jgi:hypothetical protein
LCWAGFQGGVERWVDGPHDGHEKFLLSSDGG